MTDSDKLATSPSERSQRMTSMEKFHWLDQNPEFPNYVFATLRFDIRIDPKVAQQSLAVALSRQPLAAMQPELVGGRWCWKPIQDTKFDSERFFCTRTAGNAAEENQSNAAGNKFLAERPYASYFLTVTNSAESDSSGTTASEIRFHSHHAASDGVASIGLINDWLVIYNNLVAGEPAEAGLVELDDSSFHRRGVLGLWSWSYLKGLPQQTIALFGAAKFIFRKTKTIAPQTLPIENPTTYPAIKGVWIDAKTLQADRRRASDNQVGFTAWCMARCFVAIERWNKNRQTESKDSQSQSTSVWRILLPFSTRSAGDRASIAANRTAVIQIDRQVPACGTQTIPFCQSIDHEINVIRRWQLEKMFLIAIRLASVSNTWLSKIANNPVSRGAAIFTHLGRPYKRAMIHVNRLSKSAASPMLLARPVDFDLAGPIRTGTPINISFARFDHRLKISLHYDSQTISPAEADRLLATIVELFSIEAA